MNKRLSRGKISLLASVFVTTTFMGGVNVLASTAKTGIRDITSQQVVKEMKVGWNLGNTMDATGGETNWGNPLTTHAMIDKVKAAGFNTLRLPITWDGHIGAAPDYAIDATWMNRVEEIANYAFDNNMYVIINLHHEDGWLKPYYANEAEVKAKITKVWTQIANRFKDYGDYLIFETMNEPRPVGAADEWSGCSYENRDMVNRYNLTAVNTIRATGGNNALRHIMVPTLAAAALSTTMNDYIVPNNDSRVIVSLHMYSPYFFSADLTSQWTTATWGSDADKAALSADFDAVYNKFVKNGRAVVIGEMGTINKNNLDSRVKHAEYYAKEATVRGITPIWWDNGYCVAGKEQTFGIFNRKNLTWCCPEVMQAFIRGAGATQTQTSYSLGDVNKDGKVNAIDYAVLKSILLGTNTNVDLSVSDMNKDGKVNALDLAVLKKMLLS